MTRFVVFSDIHLHEWTYGSKPVTASSNPKFISMNDRLVEQWIFLDNMFNYCKANEIKHIFFCGDLFHKFGILTAPVIQVAVSAFYRMHSYGMRVYALVGNHDMYSKNGTQHALHCISPYATIVSHPMHVEILDSVPISLAPYTESEEVLKQFLKGTAKDSFVFMHQGVANVPMGSGFVVNEILKPDMIPDHISLAFTGHYHAHRQVGNLVVVGAPMQQSYADEGEDMGFLDVDLETSIIKRILNNTRKFFTIKEGETYDHIPDGSFVRVVGTGGLVCSAGKDKMSTFEIINSPKDIEIVTTNKNITVRNLIEEFFKTSEFNADEIKYLKEILNEN